MGKNKLGYIKIPRLVRGKCVFRITTRQQIRNYPHQNAMAYTMKNLKPRALRQLDVSQLVAKMHSKVELMECCVMPHDAVDE